MSTPSNLCSTLQLMGKMPEKAEKPNCGEQRHLGVNFVSNKKPAFQEVARSPDPVLQGF